MLKMARKILIVSLLISLTFSSLADRGIGRRSKNKIMLNITTPTTLRSSLFLNLKSGLKYTGNLLNTQQLSGTSFTNNNIVTFQKGNTVYIIPFRQKMIAPESTRGYLGMKLIIRSH